MPIETPFRNLIELQNGCADLVRDVQHVRNHEQPDRGAFTNAPRLDNWHFAVLFSPCLVGEVTGHPLLGDRPRIHTSQLMFLDLDQGWVRTWSRFYRLGRQIRANQSH